MTASLSWGQFGEGLRIIRHRYAQTRNDTSQFDNVLGPSSLSILVKMPAIIEKDVTIVGGGFGGCYLLHLLREQGFSTILLEANQRLGGVWASSCYPGARVDCELPYYGFSDPAIWSTWIWTERYPDWRELRRYFEHVDDVWKLSQDVVYQTRVTEAKWEEEAGNWLITTGNGQQYRSKWFLSATGTSFKPNYPSINGLDKFAGQIHHSAAWPEDGVELKGKRVAVIGAGSTGIQVMQEAAKVSSHVVQYMRTPNYAIPMRQRKITEEEIYQHKSHVPHVFKACRTTPTGLPIMRNGRKVFDDSEEKRMKTLEEGWKRGGFNWCVYLNLCLHASDADQILSEQEPRRLYRPSHRQRGESGDIQILAKEDQRTNQRPPKSRYSCSKRGSVLDQYETSKSGIRLLRDV